MSSIWNPVDQVAASYDYIKAKYGGFASIKNGAYYTMELISAEEIAARALWLGNLELPGDEFI